jgi:hypothetical protein
MTKWNMPLKERIECKSIPEPNNGCWLWTSFYDPQGYGRIQYRGECCKAPRLSYEAFKGPIPKGLHVLHTCDVRACVNPEHLWLGTNQDNINDKMRKGRYSNGKGPYKPRNSL